MLRQQLQQHYEMI